MERFGVTSVLVLALAFAAGRAVNVKQIFAVPPEIFMDTAQLARHDGYVVQPHRVQTSDGYVLTLHRLSRATRPGGSPVLLQHGLYCASDLWLLAGPGASLAYLLADSGYDVWLGNVRGNRYSRKHVTLSPWDSAFWNFSFHEIGMFDVPATIDYIIATTGHPRIHYVGHSMGNTAFYVMASLRPEYNSKIRVAVGLSPVAFLGKKRAPISKLLFPFRSLIMFFAEKTHLQEVYPYSPSRSTAGYFLCRDGVPTQQLCVSAYFLTYGSDNRGLNRTQLPFYLSHIMSGTSLKTLLHFMQNLAKDSFRLWDYGPAGNQRHYGQRAAPDYDLRRVTAPVALHYSAGDSVLLPRGVRRLSRFLPNMVEMYQIPTTEFNHLGYLVHIDVKRLLYDKVMDTLARY